VNTGKIFYNCKFEFEIVMLAKNWLKNNILQLSYNI